MRMRPYAYAVVCTQSAERVHAALSRCSMGPWLCSAGADASACARQVCARRSVALFHGPLVVFCGC